MIQLCNECPCNCIPVTRECITQNSDIKDPTILQDSHYRKATDDIDSLIGIECADEFCEALTQAVQDLNNNPEQELSDFLPEKWLNIINNRHFKKWYSNRLLWHWLHGASISELSASGLVVLSNTDDDYKNDFQQAGEKERLRLQDSAEFYSSQARTKFLNYYWNKNKNLYSCIEDICCKKVEKCEDLYPPDNGIGMEVI